jgi:hypothetical protein
VITSSPGPTPAMRRVDGECLQRRIAEELDEVFLEALGLRPGRHPARAQRVDDLGNFFFANLWQRERQEWELVGHGITVWRSRRAHGCEAQAQG